MQQLTTNEMALKPTTKQALGAAAAILLIILTASVAAAQEYVPNNQYNPTGEPINPSFTNSSQGTYDYEVTGAPYQAYFEDNLQTGQAVRMQAAGHEFIYDLSGGKMQWVEGPNKTKSISSISASTPTINGTTITYPAPFTDTDVEYEANDFRVKENFVLQQLPAGYDPNKHVYLEYTGEVQFSNELTIYAEGTNQTGKSFQTNGRINFNDDNNNTIFYLPAPTAIDDNGTSGEAYYNVKPNSGKLTFGLRVNSSFLETAAYPVRVDPTFEIDYTPTPGELLTDGLVYTHPDTEFNTSDVTAQLTDNNTATGVLVGRISRSTVTYLATIGNNPRVSINAQLATAGDGNFADAVATAGAQAIDVNETRLSNETRLIFDVRPDSNADRGRTIQIRELGGDNTVYGSFTTSQSTTTFSRYTIDLTNVEAGATGFEFFNANGRAIDIDYLQVNYNNESNGDAVTGHWSQTYDGEFQWFVRVYKPTAGTADSTVWAYSDADNLSNQSVTQSLAGTGYFNINVTGLLDWQTTNTALDYTSLRYHTNEPTTVTELRLRVEGNDTTPPTIQGCAANATTLFDGETARLNCTVTDNLDVDTVNASFGGAQVQFLKNGGPEYYYEYTCNAIGTDQTNNWDLVNATDILGLSNTTNPATTITCRRHCDYPGTGAWNIIKSFACEISQPFTDLGESWNINSFAQTNITSNVSNFSTLNVSSNSTVYISGNTTVTIE